ncbi:MAG: hypothetical protein MUP90_04695 [Gammaproteobacteria bacterium]|nr:hypothetical protein [Gammaproteobacteria bacterium]
MILAGIAASIGMDPDFEVVGHEVTIDQQDLYALHPDVVIFDLEAVQPDFRYMLAQELPGLLLIGIDPETNRAVVWSGQKAEGMSSQDLVQVIHQNKFNIPNSNLSKEKRK